MRKRVSEKTFLNKNFLGSSKSPKILTKIFRAPTSEKITSKELFGVLTKTSSSKKLEKRITEPTETEFSGATPEFSVANNPNLTRTRISTSAVSSITKKTVIDILPINHGNAAKWTIALTNGSKVVSSEIFASWNEGGANLTYTEFGVNTLTNDDGFFNFVVEKNNILLKFTPAKDIWNAKSIRTVLGLYSEPIDVLTFSSRTFSWIFPVPINSSDPIGENGDRSYDENFFYAKIDNQWVRTPLVDFIINISPDSGENEYWYDNLPFVDRPRTFIPRFPNNRGQGGAQTFDDDYFYIKSDVWKRALLVNFTPSKMTIF